MGKIESAIRVARNYYDDKTYYHAIRVAAYAAESNLIPDNKLQDSVILAILHDLLEDTEFDDAGMFGYYMEDCLGIITKKEATYEDYLRKIKENYMNYPEAYWVKLADIKDHLCQTETLTNELKEKYLKALPCLL